MRNGKDIEKENKVNNEENTVCSNADAVSLKNAGGIEHYASSPISNDEFLKYFGIEADEDVAEELYTVARGIDGVKLTPDEESSEEKESRLPSFGDIEPISVSSETFDEVMGFLGVDTEGLKNAVIYDRREGGIYVVRDGVTEIENEEFASCEDMKEIILPNSLVHIGDKAFYNCTGLTRVEIPDTVAYIGKSAFEECRSLKEVKLPSELTYMRDSLFAHCHSLVVVDIPQSVEYIGESVFWDCTSLEYAEIPRLVAGIKYGTFAYCENLVEVKIPDSVKSIDSEAFNGCKRLKSITLPERIEMIGSEAFAYCESLKEIVLPDRIYEIETYTFDSCRALERVVLPSSLAVINPFAFCECESLKSIHFPASVELVAEGAFSGCSNLTEITVDNANNCYHSSGNCLIETEEKFLVLGCASSVIPSDGSVCEIASSAFCGNAKLEKIVIPDDVIKIGDRAFKDCIALKSVVLPSHISKIDDITFAFCSSLESVEIPDEVTSIGKRAFYECESLKNVKIGSSVTVIAPWSFGECKSIEEIVIPKSVRTVGDAAFSGCKKLRRVYIHGHKIEVGDRNFRQSPELTLVAKRHSDAISYATKHKIKTEFAGEHREDIGFMYGTKLNECLINEKRVVIPDGVTEIGTGAFKNCPDVEELVLPESLECLESFAFAGLSSLKKINIPEKIHCITDNAFLKCYSLEEIVLHGSVYVIEQFAFAFCKSLKRIDIPASVVILAPNAFLACESLECITVDKDNEFFHSENNCLILTEKKELLLACKNSVIPDGGSVTRILNSAFHSCIGLTDVYIPAAIDFIAPNPFSNCRNLNTFTVDKDNAKYEVRGNALVEKETGTLISGCKNTVIPSDGSIKAIADFAFMGCTGLVSIEIPESVTYIGDCAFFGCEDLESVFVAKGVERFGTMVFHTLGVKDPVIYVYDGSEAHSYTNAYGYKARVVDKDPIG